MNRFPQSADPAVDEQASMWAARIEGSTLTAADRNALDAWLGADPGHRALLSAYCQFSADLEPRLSALAAAGLVGMPPAARRSRRWIPWAAAGAALAAAACIAGAMVLWVGRPKTQDETLATAAAVRQTLVLADGSQVELNAQTNLRVEISRSERRVRLASGEAFFSVSNDAHRLFVVETPAGSVSVAGTRFNVRADAPGFLEITVLEGTVQARPIDATGSPAAPVPLGACSQLTAGREGVRVRTLTPTATADALAWRQGKVVFNDTPLDEALARFARYHGCGITSTPATAKSKLSVGGIYSVDDLNGFLAHLEGELPVRIVRGLNGTVQVSLRSEE